MNLSNLTAVSPIDGRYGSKTQVLSAYFSECALIKYRIRVEIEYFIALAKFSHLEMVAKVSEEDYYVRMMVAWYFATALAKQYEATIPYIEQQRLSSWVHNKTIQKACESYRISPEQKSYLKGFKIKSFQSPNLQIF